jgi:ubiquinone/menaquinone biosynthesis C-methylase UbiE
MIRSLYLWACERLYHELAPEYDLISRLVSAGAWPAWRRSVLPHLRGDRLLELGFGTGELLAELLQNPPGHPSAPPPTPLLSPGTAGAPKLERGHQAVSRAFFGLELSPRMHAVTARRLSAQPLAAPRVQASALTMPFAAGAFTSVFATFPAPYILAPTTLAECARVLRPGGRLVIAGLWVRLHDARLRRAAPIFYTDPPVHYQAQLRQRVEDAGFAAAWCVASVNWADVPILVATRP